MDMDGEDFEANSSGNSSVAEDGNSTGSGIQTSTFMIPEIGCFLRTRFLFFEIEAIPRFPSKGENVS